MFLQFSEGMMTLFYLVGKLSLDDAVLYFKYFSQLSAVLKIKEVLPPDVETLVQSSASQWTPRKHQLPTLWCHSTLKSTWRCIYYSNTWYLCDEKKPSWYTLTYFVYYYQWMKRAPMRDGTTDYMNCDAIWTWCERWPGQSISKHNSITLNKIYNKVKSENV